MFFLEPSGQCRLTHSALRRRLSSRLCGGSKMSLLDGPLNVFGQRATGESVRTQNGELCADVPGLLCAPHELKLCRH